MRLMRASKLGPCMQASCASVASSQHPVLRGLDQASLAYLSCFLLVNICTVVGVVAPFGLHTRDLVHDQWYICRQKVVLAWRCRLALGFA